jgi:hypothetical protein
MSLDYITWDNRLLRFGIEISTKASLPEIVTEAQKGAEEQPEDAKYYALFEKGSLAVPPWTQSLYELKPKEELAMQVTIVSRNSTKTVAVPKYHHEVWQGIAYRAIPQSPLVVCQSGPAEFSAYCEDEFRDVKVRFFRGTEGEEHIVRVLPQCENQTIRVREALGREMIPDESQPPEDGVIFVKSADGSPPDPTFERDMCDTLGDDPTQYHIHIHRDDTPATITEGLKKLHPDVNPSTMLIDGGEVEDDWPMSD